jgi:hypothetical protein
MAAEARSNFMLEHSLVWIVVRDPLPENLHPRVTRQAEQNVPGDEKSEQRQGFA